MIHELKDGDVLMLGMEDALLPSEAEFLRDHLAAAVLNRLDVNISSIIIERCPGLFEVLRKAP